MNNKRLSTDAVFYLALACQGGKSVPLTDANAAQRSPVQVLWKDAAGMLTNAERKEVESWAAAEDAEFKASVRRGMDELQKLNGTTIDAKA